MLILAAKGNTMGKIEPLAPSKRVRIVLCASAFAIAAIVPSAGFSAEWSSAEWSSGKAPTAEWSSGKAAPNAEWSSGKRAPKAEWSSGRAAPTAEWSSRATGRAAR
jgi:hypothetical protein